MNLIYLCVFYQENYIELLKLLITSISIKSNINNNTTKILIMTSPSFLPLIKKKLESINLPLKYYILDLHTLFEAGCARLNIFKYEEINKYEKILYLDTDILLNSDINILFNLKLSSDKIYALEESIISDCHHGKEFFDFKKYDKNLSAFTTGILLFKNTKSIKLLFDTINLHIIDYIYKKNNSIPECLDQPFIVYNAIIQNKYNNQILKKYVQNNPFVVSSDKIIYHFPGRPGNYVSKVFKMTIFWEKINNKNFKTISFNKNYSWGQDSITFLEDGTMNAFGKGKFKQIDTHTFEAQFGNKIHSLLFNNEFTEFTSTRKCDNHQVKGKLL
jgi:lipopolysaccharide biosynthesis glycosyltransferase